MTKELASSVADMFNSMVNSFTAEVRPVGRNYCVEINCGHFISSLVLRRLHMIIDVYEVLPYIECFDNEMFIIIAC